MPEVLNQASPSAFPEGQGKGRTYSPLPEKIENGTVYAHAVQTINADAETLYRKWRQVETAPRWQEYVVSVTPTSTTGSHWVLGDPDEPTGARVEFDSEITEDIPGKRIAWQSVTEAVPMTGVVTFEADPGGRGTRVTLEETAAMPGGKLTNFFAGLAKRTPSQIVIEDLRHFKQLAEAGEIPTVVKNPHGPRGLTGSFKKRMVGENNPTPPGTSVLA